MFNQFLRLSKESVFKCDKHVFRIKELFYNKQTDNIFENEEPFCVNTKSTSRGEKTGKICKFCLSFEEKASDMMISVCDCKGNLRFSHISCLKKKQESSLKIQKQDNLLKFSYLKYCENCKAKLPS